jgi:hypothetical protein
MTGGGRGSPGVYLNHQVKAASSLSAQEATGVWVADQLYVGQLSDQGQLGFAISKSGIYAAAFNEMQSGLLMYTESMDGTTWSTPVTVDVNGTTGQYPSLAFDADGNAAIAYYRCSSVEMATSCDAATDGLYLARRAGTTWSITAVSANPDINDGLFPALAFVNGKAVIAFQETGYDPISKQSTITWWAAEEP